MLTSIFALPPLTQDDIVVLIFLGIAVLFGIVILGFVIYLARRARETTQCSKCQSTVPVGNKTCKKCGAKMPAPTQSAS